MKTPTFNGSYLQYIRRYRPTDWGQQFIIQTYIYIHTYIHNLHTGEQYKISDEYTYLEL